MLIIGIAGGTGSGKTTVVHQIMNELPDTEVGIISQDSYYKRTTIYLLTNALYSILIILAIDFALLVAHLKERNRKQYSNPFILFHS
jgi:uridine kinase